MRCHLLVQGRELSWLVISLHGGLCQPSSANRTLPPAGHRAMVFPSGRGADDKDDPSLTESSLSISKLKYLFKLKIIRVFVLVRTKKPP